MSLAQGQERRPAGQDNSGKPLCAPSSLRAAPGRAHPRGLRAERGRAGPELRGVPARRCRRLLLTWAQRSGAAPSAPWRMNGPGSKVRGSREGQGMAGHLRGCPVLQGAASPDTTAGAFRDLSRSVGGAGTDASLPGPAQRGSASPGAELGSARSPKPRSQHFWWCCNHPRGIFCADVPGEE